MGKRTFEVEVERKDRYTIEIDDSVITEEWMEDFRQVFYEFETMEQHVEHIAQLKARYYNGSFPPEIEGYGSVAVHGKVRQDGAFPFPAINFVKMDEDNDVDVVVKEIETTKGES